MVGVLAHGRDAALVRLRWRASSAAISTDFFIKRTGNRKWGRRLFGMVGHGAVCRVLLSQHAGKGMDSPWLFVPVHSPGDFWNDMTMGAAWASCIDIGGRYSGIVSGCMNTIGNLGGFAANIITGLGAQSLPRRASEACSRRYKIAIQHAWLVNFVIFGIVYVLACFFWLGFDATKPIAPEEGDGH